MPQKRDLDSETSSDGENNRSLTSGITSRVADQAPIGRRGCLRLAGAALASTAGIAASGNAAARELVNASDVSGGTYNVSSGEEVRILVGENQYGNYGDLENCLIDASGADVQIKSFGNGWKIQNVGIEGPTENTNPVIDVKTDGGSGLVENVYVGDGGKDGQPGIFVKKEHSGTITIRDTYVGNFRDNGIYASTPGKGGNGATKIENCYGENNGRAHFRIGGSGSSVSGSVAVTDNDTLTSRGVWARRDDCEVVNTDISLTDSGSATSVIWATGGASVDYQNSDYETVYPYGDFEGPVDTSDVGSSPSTSPPSGVPTSPEEAAGGSASSSPSDAEESSEEESSEDSEEESSEDSEEESSEDSEEESSEDSEEEDEESTSEGDAEDDANSETEGDEDDDDLPNTVTITSQDGERCDYEFTVTGDLEAGDESSSSYVSGSSCDGAVWGHYDDYNFSGEFDDFTYEGEIEIEINGKTVYTA